jgi:signal transduction histidine kinase
MEHGRMTVLAGVLTVTLIGAIAVIGILVAATRRPQRELEAAAEQMAAERARLRALASSVIEAADRERATIAHGLHDSAAQSLTAVLLQLSVAEQQSRDPALTDRLARLHEATTEVLEEVRLLAHRTYPRVLDDLGLVAGLKSLIRGVEARRLAKAELRIEELPASIPPVVGTVVYRVAEEALANAVTHGRPSRVVVTVGTSGGTLRLVVVDDGCGFDVPSAERQQGGVGLFTMRERTSLVDGVFDIHSAPGRGTRVAIEVPLSRRELARATRSA